MPPSGAATGTSEGKVGMASDLKNVPQGPLLTRRQAARYLNVTDRQMTRLLYDYGLPRVKLGGRVYVKKADADAYIEKHRIDPDANR
jgi:excisionase family DNA binding protein